MKGYKQALAYSIPQFREKVGGLSHGKVYDLIRRGELKTFKVGSRRFISHEAACEFIMTREQAS